MIDKYDFKGALAEWNEIIELDKQTGINNPVIEKGRETAKTIQSALRLADRLQSGELKYEILEQAIDEMGWEEINAFKNQEGQSIYEDAGGYFLRKIKCLFGIYPQDEIVTYQKAAKRLIEEAKSNGRADD